MPMCPAFFNGGAVYQGPSYNGKLGQSLHHSAAGKSDFLPSKPKGYIEGLTCSVNGTDANHDTDIAAGYALSDDSALASRVLMQNASSLTKQLDASWAVGTNQGGLDTGSIATSTWYAIYLIRRSDTGVVDALYSTSFTSPTMPANYDQKQLIGQVRTNGSSNIISYTHVKDRWTWASAQTDLSTTSPTAGGATLRVTTPPINTDVRLGLFCNNSSATRLIASSPYIASTDGIRATQQVAGVLGTGDGDILTDASGNVLYNVTGTSGWSSLIIQTISYNDLRGRC